MSADRELLTKLTNRLRTSESLELEFKEAAHALPRSLWETVSAFANTVGGWIVLGVAKSGQIAGITDPDGTLLNLNTSFRNPQRISYPICTAKDMSIEDIGGTRIVLIRVPAASRKNRPVYIKGNPYAGTFIRRNEGDFRCTKQEVDRMMREASEEAADSAIVPHLTWEDLDRDSVIHYRHLHQARRPTSAWNRYGGPEFLKAIRAVAEDPSRGIEGVTVAGLLMLGRAEDIRAWRSRHLIDFRSNLEPSSGATRWEDRIAWEGNLLEGFTEIYSRLTRHQPVRFELVNGVRAGEGWLHEVLREALVNLLVHADYAETDASIIKQTIEGYVFRNPGSSRVPRQDLLAGDRSDPRNPILVRMFRLIGLAEEAGTGIAQIFRLWRDQGLQLPEIDVGTERYEFSLRLRYLHLLDEDDRAWLTKLGGPWDEAEQIALVTARHEGRVDNQKLRTVTGLHPADASKVLTSLKQRDYLRSRGAKRGTYYELGPRAGAGRAQGSFPGMASGISGTEERTVRDAKLLEITQGARGRKRMPRAELQKLIVSMCTIRPLGVREMARFLKRNENYLGTVVHELVETGKLEMTEPTTPRHPSQRYRTAPSVLPD